MNPHMHLKAISPRGIANRLWQCVDCGLRGTLDAVRARRCTFVHPPCTYCGQTPECAIDCEGIARALGRGDVHVIGAVPRRNSARKA